MDHRTEFTNANPELLSPDNAMGFLSDDGGETYNRCHCKLGIFTICLPHNLTRLLIFSLEQL